jgi:hypothetical protein
MQLVKDYNMIYHWIYHFFFSSKLLITLNLQVILFTLLIDLPRKNKKAFIGVASATVLFLWTNTILLAKKVLERGGAFHVKMKRVLLILATFILSYALLYYSLYNYDKDSFYSVLDKKENRKDSTDSEIEKSLIHIDEDSMGLSGSFVRYFDMIYFTITTMFTGSFGDIMPKTRIVRLIVISQFIIAVILISILLSKAN